MSLEITYSSGERNYKWRLSLHEVEALNGVAFERFRDAIDSVLNVNSFGEETTIKKKILHNAVEFLINELKNNSAIVMDLFEVKAEIPRGSGKFTAGGEAICGLKIDGEQYDIEYGLNKCILIKKWQDDKLKVHQSEPLDIRHLSTIETDIDSFIGEVKISKREISKMLVGNLEKIKIFLDKCTCNNIKKILG